MNPAIDICFIDSKWQASYYMFNMLKKDILLYKKFSNYRFVLFYELDAWVFKDDLLYWCEKGYDYIGAPWFEGHNQPNSENIIGVGNGDYLLEIYIHQFQY